MPSVKQEEDAPEAVVSSSSRQQQRELDHEDHHHDENDDNNDDDEVVQELDVYISPRVAEQLYLIQYPLQQHPRRGGQHHHRRSAAAAVQPTAARIKPRHGLMELEQPLPDNIEREGNYHMFERTFESHTIPVQTHMCLGKMVTAAPVDDDDEVIILDEDYEEGDANAMRGFSDSHSGQQRPALYLVPLTHIRQMRPSFSHVDEDTQPTPDEQQQQQDKAAEEGGRKKPVSFQRKESDRAIAARRSSYAYKKAAEDSEEWQELTVHARDSSESREITNRVILPASEMATSVLAPPDHAASDLDGGSTNNAAAAASVINDSLYVRSLNYMPTTSSATMDDDVHLQLIQQQHHFASTGQQLDVTTIAQRLTVLLLRGWPIPYSILRSHFARDNVKEEDIFTALGVCAVLVRGNFLLHSNFLSMPPSLRQARTFILHVLETEGIVHRSPLDRVYQNVSEVSSDKLLSLLKQVCRWTKQGWEPRIEEDAGFASRYPGQSAVHAEYWDRQAQRYERQFDLYQKAVDKMLSS